MRNSFNKPIDVEEKWASLGYKPETISLLFVVPLVQIGWAEGYLQNAERKTILRFARDLNISSQTPGYEHLLAWLDERPSNEFFAEATAILNYWLKTMPARQSESLGNILLIGCLEVARSSSDIGLHPRRERIRREEREQLFLLGNRLGFSPAFVN